MLLMPGFGFVVLWGGGGVGFGFGFADACFDACGELGDDVYCLVGPWWASPLVVV